MGFFDSAKKFLNDAMEKEQKRQGDFQRRVDNAVSKFSYLSQDELKQKYNSTSDAVEKAAIVTVMKRNGWA